MTRPWLETRLVKPIIPLTTALAVLVSGCTATIDPFEAEVAVPAVKVKTGDEPGFCPPGQAKKGAC